MAEAQSISVRYFAAAADAAGRREEVLALVHTSTLAEVAEVLVRKYGADMERVLSVSGYLVGDELTRDVTRVAGSSVDVLPPFAGG
ncbi:molybdopterin synthase sulfur carrier subunit [Rhodococcus sp. 27YEA15]|uniref:MoaD/ThiS family protein n=1 Tax=Rhodococcus sp. 27YEA15 TaxID=3156259 RepID=UPI003C7D7F05